MNTRLTWATSRRARQRTRIGALILATKVITSPDSRSSCFDASSAAARPNRPTRPLTRRAFRPVSVLVQQSLVNAGADLSAAVDRQHGAGRVTGQRACQERHRIGDL